MASPSHPAGPGMVTVKIQYLGITRRTKMPLRDMVAKTLESNIRSFLQIPADVETTFERYSDSAGSYVLLDPENVPIYKQLYRAAKAKSKLKIRVTTQEPKIVPKPVTVEDEPEAFANAPETTTTEEAPKEAVEESHLETSPVPTPTADAPAPTPASTNTPPETTLPLRIHPLAQTYNPALFSDATRFLEERQDARPEFASRLADLMERQSGLASRLASHSRPCRPSEPDIFNTPTPPSMHWPVMCPATGSSFAVCCNNCDKAIPDIHYHCSTCDDGDFDLCQPCIDQGVTCHSQEHWLIKRSTVNGRLVQSTTEIIAPKPKEQPKPEVKVETTIETKIEPKTEIKDELPVLPQPLFEPLTARWASLGVMRTCNCCVQELPEAEFLHCVSCEDFDLCQPCFAKNAHGHHPMHAFVPAVKDTKMPDHITVKMSPGRNQIHYALCDGCDKYITGVRHKCLDCPDWDYCSECFKTSNITHNGHRFVAAYERLSDVRGRSPAPVHVGVCCDGPLCADGQAYPSYIRGIRYKCAVCNDLDFCANCEAHPATNHNKTHPLIKFKTPVRHVSVTTCGEHQDGQRMRSMGDQPVVPAKAPEPVVRSNSINAVRTIVDVKPTEPAPVKMEAPKALPKPEAEAGAEVKEEKQKTATPVSTSPEELRAAFVKDTVQDGTILPPNHIFKQTWTLRNDGQETWPAGCSLKFVGGDYMGHVDSNHPADVSELATTSESSVCSTSISPGQEQAFTVLLRTPARPGKVISYWRMTTPSGHRFGHRLWCDVNVRVIKEEPKPEIKVESRAPSPVPEPKVEEADSQASSQMIFPKLEKESPVASVHEAAEPTRQTDEPSAPQGSEDLGEDWDYSDEGFMTDEEYDILDASDEEYLEEQKKKLSRK